MHILTETGESAGSGVLQQELALANYSEAFCIWRERGVCELNNFSLQTRGQCLVSYTGITPPEGKWLVPWM